jgi:NADPH:quinone reductase-like Zn-dependent oxidoreductase
MKSVQFARYGSADVLELVDVSKPVPGDGEALVRIRAASVNPLDWHRMRGAPVFARLTEGVRRPKDPRLGADLAGRVEAVGGSVTRLRVGDDVFGSIPAGSFAEYAAVPESAVAAKPVNSSVEEAAAVPVAAYTALQGLRKGKVTSGQRVLVNGSSGGVGTSAVQIAKSFGADVTAVCSTRNIELVRSLGADRVIDYTQADFTQDGRRYDLIFDAVGNRLVSEYRRLLAPGGSCVVAGFTSMSRLFAHAVLGPLTSRDRRVGLMGVAKPNLEDLLLIAKLMEAGSLKPVIDRRYSLRDVAAAVAYLEAGHARGKVLITIAGEG